MTNDDEPLKKPYAQILKDIELVCDIIHNQKLKYLPDDPEGYCSKTDGYAVKLHGKIKDLFDEVGVTDLNTIQQRMLEDQFRADAGRTENMD